MWKGGVTLVKLVILSIPARRWKHFLGLGIAPSVAGTSTGFGRGGSPLGELIGFVYKRNTEDA